MYAGYPDDPVISVVSQDRSQKIRNAVEAELTSKDGGPPLCGNCETHLDRNVTKMKSELVVKENYDAIRKDIDIMKRARSGYAFNLYVVTFRHYWESKGEIGFSTHFFNAYCRDPWYGWAACYTVPGQGSDMQPAERANRTVKQIEPTNSGVAMGTFMEDSIPRVSRIMGELMGANCHFLYIMNNIS